MHRVYAEIHQDFASGHLRLTRGKAQKDIYFFKGLLRFASSNIRNENAGGMQLETGELDQTTFDAAVKYMRVNRTTFAEALIKTEALPLNSLNEAFANQVQAVSTGALGWQDGSARFAPGEEKPAGVPEHSLNPLEVVLRGLPRYFTVEVIRGFLKRYSQKVVIPTARMNLEKHLIQRYYPAEQVTTFIHSGQTVSDILEKTRSDDDLHIVFFLLGTGLARLGGRETAGKAADTPRKPTGMPTSTRESAFIKDIRAEYRRIAEATHYEVLGLTQSAGNADIQGAYLKAAKKWHADRFARHSLGDASKLVNSIFARVVEARDTLNDHQRRAEYDLYLDRKAKGLPTDVGVILRAENLFVEGMGFMKMGKAAKALERFEEAISLNKGEAELYAWRGYALYRVEGKVAKEKALADINRGLNEQPDMPAANFFLGMIALDEGKEEEAARRFEQTLERDPRHVEAKRQLNRIKASKKGPGRASGKR